MRAETHASRRRRAAGAARPRCRLLARRRHRELLLIWLLLAPALAIFLLFRIIPLLWNLVLSFQFWSPMKAAEWAGLFHYEEMLVYDDVFWTALQNTFVYMLTAPIAIVIALGLALLVDSRIRGRGVYRTIIFISYPLDGGRGRDHLALALRRAGRADQLHAALGRHPRPADRLPRELRDRAARR